MNNRALKVGYWASVIAIIAFIAYTICYAAILFVNPIFLWTDLENYINTVQSTNQTFKHIAMIFMIVYGACFVIQLCSIEEFAELSKKYYAKIAKLFGTGFFILIGINYFIQLSTVRIQINAGQTNGLEQFIFVNSFSGVAAINMLGWTIFFGMSCIFAALAFGSSKIEQITKYALFANGVIMLVGGGAYLLNIVVVIFLCMNLGMGAAVLTATIALCKVFKSV